MDIDLKTNAEQSRKNWYYFERLYRSAVMATEASKKGLRTMFIALNDQHRDAIDAMLCKADPDWEKSGNILISTVKDIDCGTKRVGVWFNEEIATTTFVSEAYCRRLTDTQESISGGGYGPGKDPSSLSVFETGWIESVSIRSDEAGNSDMAAGDKEVDS